MYVLLTNDDGISAPNLRALYAALRKAGHSALVVAPMRQQSGVGHALTVFEPLRATEISDGDFHGTGVYGTPTDCVKLALGRLAPQRPDLVMAGINLGPNVGPEIFYSGTVGAAAEAAHASLPSMAISHASHEGCAEIDRVAEHAVALAEKIAWKKLPPRRVINVNYPAIPLAAALAPAVCPQSPAPWRNEYSERRDPRGERYWWLTGGVDAEAMDIPTDRELLEKGHITITPLSFEYTDVKCLEILSEMDIENG